jgi:dolichyl-diphosphooligosaccharide--protein glycosyltransferase
MVAALVAFVPFSMALLFFYRPPAKEAKLFYPILLLVCALILVWGGMDLPFRMSSSVWNKFLYISKQSAHDFPDIGQFISEQAKLSLSKLVEYTLTNWLAFGGSVLGVCWLCLVRFREMAFLAVPFALGICSYLFAQRFAIFIVPILALGLGWCVSLIWKHFQQNKKVHVLIGFLLLYLASTMHLKGISRGPSVFGEMVAGMAEVNRLTPKNAVVWNWGNIGYPLIYWGRRTTVSDGQVHSGERSVYNAIPFIVPDYRLSANFIRFYVKRGVKGINMFYKALGNDKDKGLKLIQQILVNGPVEAKKIILNENIGSVSWMQSTDDWLEFFYPAQSAPLYIFFDWSSNNLLHILYWFGTWDVETKNAGRLVSRVQLAYGGSVDGTVLSTLSGVSADLELGILKLGENEYELRSAAYTSDTETVEHFYPENKKGKVHLEMNIDKAFSYVAYQDEKLGTTLFNKMYWRKVHPPEKYFQLVSAEKPFYQIWKVGGDLRE